MYFTAFGAWDNRREWVDVLTADFNDDGVDDLFGRIDGSDSLYVSATIDGSFTTTNWGRILNNVNGPAVAVRALVSA